MADEDAGERVVKVGSCWRFKGAPPWMVDAIDGDHAVLARWRDGEHEEMRRPVSELTLPGFHWRECDPEEMERPVVNRVAVHTAGDAAVRTVPGRIDMVVEPLRPSERPARATGEDGWATDAPWSIYEVEPGSPLNDPKVIPEGG